MPWDEFVIYLIKLLSKLCHQYSEDGVWIHKTNKTKGGVYFGRKFGDPDTVMVYVEGMSKRYDSDDNIFIHTFQSNFYNF